MSPARAGWRRCARRGLAALRAARAVKETTGIVGHEVVPNAREMLIGLYTRTLKEIEAVPKDEGYRKAVESFTRHGLQICQEEDWKRIEGRLCCGQVKELIDEAPDELKLIAKMIGCSAWQNALRKRGLKAISAWWSHSTAFSLSLPVEAATALRGGAAAGMSRFRLCSALARDCSWVSLCCAAASFSPQASISSLRLYHTSKAESTQTTAPTPRWFYRDEFDMNCTYPVMSIDQYRAPLLLHVPDDVPIRFELDPVAKQFILTEESQVGSHSLIADAYSIIRRGYSLMNPLTHYDICVDAIGRFLMRDGLLLMPSNSYGISSTFGSVANCLENIVRSSSSYKNIPLPIDFMMMLKDLRCLDSLEGVYPVLYNPCMIPLCKKGIAFLELHAFLRDICSFVLHKQIVLKDLPYFDNWYKIAVGNKLLELFLNYQVYDLSDPTRFLDFLRNIRSHMYQYRDVYCYTAEEVEALLHIKMPLLLSTLHKRLWDANKRLVCVKPHLHFSNGVYRPHQELLTVTNTVIF